MAGLVVGEEAEGGPAGVAEEAGGVLAHRRTATIGSVLPWTIASGTARCAAFSVSSA